MKRLRRRIAPFWILAVFAGGGAAPLSPAAQPAANAKSQSDGIALMTEAAVNFIASLRDDQRAKALFPFDADERFDWHYIPKPRLGLPVKEMDLAQLHLAHALLSTALGNRGYYKASAIMSMEAVLGEIEAREGSGNSRITRDPGLYYFSIFGDPLPDHPWGWRVEGHHLSINITAADGKLAASSPFFLGSNPHEVLDGPHKGLRILGAEEDLGRDLLKSLDDAQRGRAVISAEAPKDTFTTNQRKADLGGEPKGLPYPAMNQDQQQRLRNLIDEYISNLHPYLADLRREKISRMTGEQWSQTYFAWMGGPDKGQPDYYRVQTPLFLIEYDNTPNNANHSHTVWRDFNGDFGLDLLAMHHARDHALPFNP